MSEQSLKERLGSEPARSRVIAECVTLVDAQVRAKSGLSGLAIKGAYGSIKAIKKQFVPEVIDALLDDWLVKLQPYYEKWQAGGGSFAELVTARSEDVAEELLAVTDARAETTRHTTARKAYQKIRGSAKKNVVEAVPELGRLLERHLGAAPGSSETSPAA